MSIVRPITRNISRSIVTDIRGYDLVLDRYSGASAGYSLYDLGNRRGTVVETEATYYNPAVRLRRDSDGAHKSFPAGQFTQMLNWALEGGPTTNAYATTWYDQSGSDNDATQTTADSQPKVVDAGVLVTDANGNYRPDWDGVDDYFDFPQLASAQPITVFSIVQLDALNADNSGNSGIYAVGGSGEPISFLQGSRRNAINAGATIAGTPSIFDYGEAFVRTDLFNGASSKTWKDGVEDISGDAGSNVPTTGGTLGRYVNTNSELEGGITAFIIYPTDQSANRSAIEEALSNTITTALS